MEDSNFNFRYVRLYNLDIPSAKWLNYLQTGDADETLCSAGSDSSPLFANTVLGSPDYNGLSRDSSNVQVALELQWCYDLKRMDTLRGVAKQLLDYSKRK